ncbi:STAS domain-containing protein [Micromonospora sp. RTGN7]|uniref:STAS domain-containing protein n=1 Tax=Micromonospora sp. RTGN7 TaxID=3016526 RepID=UPI0029FF1468|nr:STAS domain-containing protein [Micromonospora sp. RTGN7]
MPSQLLTIEVTRLEAGRARLRLTGELDFDTSPELVDAADELRRDGHHDLEIDLCGVRLCDSSGLSALVVIYRRGSTPIRLTGMSSQLRQLLDRTGLTEVLAAARPATGTHATADTDGARDVG